MTPPPLARSSKVSRFCDSAAPQEGIPVDRIRKCVALPSRAICLLLSTTLGLACSTTSSPTQPDAGTCTASGACCPATAPSPSSCTPAETGLTCFYSGVAYTCAHCVPEEANDPLSWCMATPNPGCPIPAPDLGTPCNSPGLLCDYNFCAGGPGVSCVNGTWHVAQEACPQN
jgi:hypothetical protein